MAGVAAVASILRKRWPRSFRLFPLGSSSNSRALYHTGLFSFAVLMIVTTTACFAQVPFKCPEIGAKFTYSDGRERTFDWANERACGFIDEKGARFALFPDFTSVPFTQNVAGWRAGNGIEDGIWPLRVGNTVNFVTQKLPEAFGYTNTISVLDQDSIMVAGSQLATYVIRWEIRSRTYDAYTTWWYSPDYGLVVKQEFTCVHSENCAGTNWEITSVALPASASR